MDKRSTTTSLLRKRGRW